MEFRSLKYVVSACAGEQIGGSPVTQVSRVCSDSRLAQAGDLFFALAGDKFDGHDFLKEVADQGVAAVVAVREKVPPNLPCAVIAADDPRKALGRLAAKYRTEFKPPVVGVVGSNGKTTTKELLGAVLRQKLATLWSEASFNNDIGVPMTLLKLEKTHQALVQEIGTNHPGELAPLVKMAQPNLGVVTSIGREHLEFFGDVAGVAEEEGWLAELLPAAGKLFVNGDSEWMDRIIQRSRAAVIRVGLKEGNDWRASGIHVDAQGAQFRVNAPQAWISGDYRINLIGRHQVLNALLAIAVAAELGLNRAEIQKGLLECKPAKLRMQAWDWQGVTVLDDAYNANADSMAAALQTLREMPARGRRVAVLGDMAELGAHSAAAHEETGRRVLESGVDQLFTIGTMANVTAEAARSAGLKAVEHFDDINALIEAVKNFLKAGDVVLVKASRSMRLERLGEALRAGDAKKN